MKKLFNFKDNIGEVGAFALPVFVEQFAIAFMGVISAMLVSNISASAISGVNLVESLNFLIQQIFLSLEIGATVVVAQYCGRGDHESASKASVQAMLTSLCIAFLITAAMLVFPNQILRIIFGNAEAAVFNSGKIYFIFAAISFPFLSIYAITTASIRGSGNPKLSLIGVIITNVSFMVLGLIFIKIFKMGVAGAGLSLVISRMLGAVTGLFLLKTGNSVLIIDKWIPDKIEWKIQRAILLIGVPSCVESMLFSAGRLVTQTYAVSMGTQAMAVNALSNTIAIFYNIPGNTAAATAVPLVGKYLGMRDKENAKNISRIIILLSTLALATVSVILAVLARPIAGLFTTDSLIAGELVFIARTNFFVSPVAWTFSFVVPSILRASGDMKYTTSISIFSMLFLRMTVGYYLAIVMGFGVLGIWMGMYSDWCFRGILFGIRYVKGNWLHRNII